MVKKKKGFMNNEAMLSRFIKTPAASTDLSTCREGSEQPRPVAHTSDTPLSSSNPPHLYFLTSLKTPFPPVTLKHEVNYPPP